MMGLPVVSHQPNMIGKDAYRQILQADIVNDLVICPLQKCSVYSKIRAISSPGKPRR